MEKGADRTKSNRLKKLEKNLKIIDKYERYLEGEFSKARLKEGKVREKMRKEKKAIMLSIRAKRLRSPKK